jgi:hypothetical protein
MLLWCMISSNLEIWILVYLERIANVEVYYLLGSDIIHRSKFTDVLEEHTVSIFRVEE